MNIFEQYGIKDVANVTLYGITYDKYDNEVDIPVMYFDTLKVSSVEQTAQQTSARGGLGNAEHVIWNYGKEIALNIQDALYTPASQSLLWGGRFGLKPIKVKGFWIGADYPIDKYGNIQYFYRDVQEDIDKGSTVDTDWVGFYCPCDENLKYMTYKPYIQEPTIVEGTTLTRDKDIYINNSLVEIYTENNIPSNAKKADLFISKFETFSHTIFDVVPAQEKIDVILNENQEVKDNTHSMLEYQWQNSIGQMVTNTVNKEQAYDENINFCIHSFLDNNNKRFIFYNQDDNKYYSYYHFYKTITKKVKGLEIISKSPLVKIPIEKEITFKVYLGTFYIVEDWNIDNTSEEPGIHLINDGLNKTSLIENTKSKTANRMFAIDVDKNILSYNRMKDIKYSQSKLAVYIDPTTMMPYEANAHYYDCEDGTRVWGNLRIFHENENYLIWKRHRAAQQFDQILIRAQDYPGIFKIVGETYVRDRYGEDQLYQIEIPFCQLDSNINLNLEASGEPTVVDMNFKVLRGIDGTFAKLTLYDEDKVKCKLPKPTTPIIPEDKEEFTAAILYPFTNDIYCLSKDCRISNEAYSSDNQNSTYMRLPLNIAEAAQLKQEFDQDQALFAKNHKEILLIETYINGRSRSYITQQDNVNLSLTFNTGSESE